MNNEDIGKLTGGLVNQEAKEKQIAEQIRQYDESYKSHKRKIMEQVRECNMKIVENTNMIISLRVEEPVNMVEHCMRAIKAYKNRIAELEVLLDEIEKNKKPLAG